MLRLITSHSQLRTSVPRCIRKDLYNRLLIRCKSTPAAPNKIPSAPKRSPSPKTSPLPPARSTPSPKSRGSRSLGKEPPHRILIYHGGTGKTVFIGVMRITTIFVFAVSCLVVAPAFFAADFPWYTAPAIVVCGAVPMLFVAYTASPFVNYVHLALPAFARRSREEILKYAKDLPPNSTLYINTMKFTTIPRRTEVYLSDLVPGKAALRPVNIVNTNPQKQAWWKGKTITDFYVSERSKPTKATSTFYPEVWQHVYASIRKNASPHNNIIRAKQ